MNSTRVLLQLTDFYPSNPALMYADTPSNLRFTEAAKGNITTEEDVKAISRFRSGI